jgi:hypothetical protein
MLQYLKTLVEKWLTDQHCFDRWQHEFGEDSASDARILQPGRNLNSVDFTFIQLCFGQPKELLKLHVNLVNSKDHSSVATSIDVRR